MRRRKTSQTIFEIPGRILAGTKHAKVPQIPLFPPLSKGDERGISGFLCGLDVPSAEFTLRAQPKGSGQTWREKISCDRLASE
jgi:hypothetical protein